MNRHDEIDEKLARIERRLATNRETVRSHLEQAPELLELAEALRDTFGGRLVYVRVGEFEQGNRAEFDRQGQSFNFDLRPHHAERIERYTASTPATRRKRKAGRAAAPTASTWHDRY